MKNKHRVCQNLLQTKDVRWTATDSEFWPRLAVLMLNSVIFQTVQSRPCIYLCLSCSSPFDTLNLDIYCTKDTPLQPILQLCSTGPAQLLYNICTAVPNEVLPPPFAPVVESRTTGHKRELFFRGT